jgi:tRNA U34 5-methylaminomethyl-2-thiouridine-forming methyltransferase MnmC
MGLEIRTTTDGSRTLFNTQLGEPYHSVNGALTESRHVFIEAGFKAIVKPAVDVLEIGLGSGLNLLLTLDEARKRGLRVSYTAIEPHRLSVDVLSEVDHCAASGLQYLSHDFGEAMAVPSGIAWRLDASSLVIHASIETVIGPFDVVYFDAFAPNVQPELWTLAMFQRMHALLRPGGVLVTYCAKGDVRRAMQAAGFVVERLPGPPGKREMLRARRYL